MHPNLLSAPQLPLPQETCSVPPVCSLVDSVRTLKMSHALRVPLVVIKVTWVSKEVSAEDQVPRIKGLGALIHCCYSGRVLETLALGLKGEGAGDPDF